MADTIVDVADSVGEYDLGAPKRRGRPKGSKNKAKDADPLYETYVPETSWVLLRLAVADNEEGLEAFIGRYNIVGASALPNGGASVITNIGATQPLILTTQTPYEEVKKMVIG